MERAIAWFARNSVAANLLLGLVVVVGLSNLGGLKREIFPELSSEQISVTVVYPGAAPAEIERAICARVEEQVQPLEVVERVRSVAAAQRCSSPRWLTPRRRAISGTGNGRSTWRRIKAAAARTMRSWSRPGIAGGG